MDGQIEPGIRREIGPAVELEVIGLGVGEEPGLAELEGVEGGVVPEEVVIGHVR